jgi:hypothetical protein
MDKKTKAEMIQDIEKRKRNAIRKHIIKIRGLIKDKDIFRCGYLCPNLFGIGRAKSCSYCAVRTCRGCWDEALKLEEE